MSVYNWNFKNILSKYVLKPKSIIASITVFLILKNETHGKMSCITKTKNRFFFPRETLKIEGWEGESYFFFLEWLHFPILVKSLKKKKEELKTCFFLTKPSAKQTTPPIKIQVEPGLLFSWECFFHLYYHYGVKRVGNFFAKTSINLWAIFWNI